MYLIQKYKEMFPCMVNLEKVIFEPRKQPNVREMNITEVDKTFIEVGLQTFWSYYVSPFILTIRICCDHQP